MPNKDKIRKAYDLMNEHYDMGTPEEFEEQMNDAGNREIVFKTLQKHYRLDNAPDQKAFDELMGYGSGAVSAHHGVVPGGNVQQMNQQNRAELAERMKQQQNGNVTDGGQNVANDRGYQQFKQGYNQYMQQGGVKAQPQQQVAAQEPEPAQPQQTPANYVEMPTQERYYQQAVNPTRPAYMQNDEAWAKQQEKQKAQNERAQYQQDFNKWFDAYGKPALDAVNDEAAKKLNAEMQTSIKAGDRSARYGMMMSDRDENPVTAVDKVSKALAGQMSNFVLERMGIDTRALARQKKPEGAPMNGQEVAAFDQMFEEEYNRMADALQRKIYNEYAKKHAPKNTLEYVASSMMHNSLIGTVRDLVLSNLSKNEAVRLQLINQGMAQYDANMAEEAVAGAATMMADAPAFMVGGYFGNMLTKGVTAGVKAVTGKTVAPAVVKGLAMVNNSFFSWGGYGAASSYANKVKEGVYAGLDAGDMNYMKHALQNASVTEALKEGAVEGVKGVAIGAMGMGVKAATRNVGRTGRIATDIGMVPLEAAAFVTMDVAQRKLTDQDPMTAEEMMRDYGKQVMMIGLLHGKGVLMSGGREYSKDHYDENGKLVQGAYTADGRVKKEVAAQLMNDTDIEMMQKGSFGELFADVKDSKQMMEVLDNAWAGNGKMVWEAIVENEAYPMMLRARVAAAHGKMIAVPRATQSQVVEGTDNGGHYLVTYASDGKVLDSVRYETKAKAEKAAKELEPMLEDQSVMELEDVASCADYTTEDVLKQLTAGNPEREERIKGAMERMSNGTATEEDMDTMDVVRMIVNDAKNDRRETVLSRAALEVYEQNGIDPREALKKLPDHRTEEDKQAIALYKERISDNMARETMTDEQYAVYQDTDSETGSVKYGTDSEGRRVIVKGTGDSVIVTDVETGETRMEDARYVTVTEERTPAEELMARKNAEMQAEQAMQQEAGAQSETTVAEAEKPTETAETIAEEELPNGALAEEGTPIKYYDENNDLVDGTYIGPDHMQSWKHVIKDKNGNVVSRRLDEDEIVLPEAKAETTAEPINEAPVETENVNGTGTAPVAATETAPANAVGAGMPLNAKGKPDPIGNGVTPERAIQYFEEKGLEPEKVKNLVEGQVKLAGDEIAKYMKKEPDPSKMDADDYLDAYEQWVQGGRAMREVENRWKAIAGEIKAREDAAKAEQRARQEAIRKQMAAEEQARIDKIREEQRKETEERERTHREFMAELERKRKEQEALEAEQANEALTGDQMAEQAVMEEQKRRERMRIGQRLAEVGQLTDLDQPADEAMAAQVAYLSPDFKVTPESLRLELGSNFGKFGREGMLRLADNNGRTISEIADAIVQAAGYDENGQWRLDANKVREELIKCIQEGSASAIEALEKRVGIGTQRPEDRPEYWTPEKIAEYEARQQQQPMTEVQQQIATASEEVNTSPTDAQKEAGNYKKGHVKLDGMEISIEQPKGSTRSGVDADGLPWSVKMNNTYGYIRGTKGKDKDHIDIFLSDNPEEGSVFVVDQIDPRTGEFDEHKVMYGFNSLEEARDAYLSNYMSDWKGLGNITEVNKTAFKVWLSESVHKTKPFADYRLVKAEQAKMGIERGYDEKRDPFAADQTQEFLNGNEGLETIEEAPFSKGNEPYTENVTSEQKMASNTLMTALKDNAGIDVLMNTQEEGQRKAAERNAEMMAVSEKFDNELQQQIDGTLPQGHIYQMGKPSQKLMDCGIPDLPITMNAARLKEKASQYGHDFDLSEVKGLVEAINNPVAVFDYGKNNDAKNIIVNIQHDGKNFLVGLFINPVVGGRHLEINSIRNVFPRNTQDWVLWIQEGKLRGGDTKKIQALIDKQRKTLADVDYLDLNDVAKILENGEYAKFSGENILETDKNSQNKDYLKRPNGTVYGWVEGNKIHLTPEGINPNTPIHEYSHLWAESVKKNAPKLWENVKGLMKETDIWKEVLGDELYQNIHGDEDRMASEVLSRLSGRRGAEKLTEMAKNWMEEHPDASIDEKAAHLSIIARMKQAIKDVWNWVGKELFGIEKFGSAEEVADRTLYDLMNGTDLKLNEINDSKTEFSMKEKKDEVKVWTSTRLKKLFKGLDGVDEQTKDFCSVSLDFADNINEVKTSLDKSYMGQPHVREIKVTVPKSMTYEKDGELFVKTSDIKEAISKAVKEASDFAKANERKMVRDESTIGTGNEELIRKAYNTKSGRYDEKTVKLDENNYVDAMFEMSSKYTNRVHDELQSLKNMVSYNEGGQEVNNQRIRGHVGQFEYTHIGQNDIVGYKDKGRDGQGINPVYGRDIYKAQWEKLEKPMQEYKEFYERMAEKAPYPWMKTDLMSKARGVEMRMERMKHLAEGVEPTNTQFGRWAASDNGSNSVRYRDYEAEDQTRTDNFKQWFGDWEKDPENASKVVDADGKPMVVYHGTQLMSMYFKDGRPYVDYTERFHTFKDGKGFFTSDRDAAESFARGKQGFYEVYLDMKKPFVIDCKGKDWDAIDGYENPDGYTRVTTDYIVNDIKRNHPEYDGVIFKNVMNENSGVVEYPIDDYVPFKAEQIKSAVDNNGDFSRENKDIRYRDYEGEDPLVKEYLDYTPEQRQENIEKMNDYEKADMFLRYNNSYNQYLTDSQKSRVRTFKSLNEMLDKYSNDEVMRPKIEAMLKEIKNRPEPTKEEYDKLVAENKAKKEELQEFYDHQKAIQKAYSDMIEREANERIAEREKARMAQKPERYQHEWTDEEKTENEDYRKKAKKHFGTTQKFSEAGYILTDGSMLDFTGRHEYTGKDASFLAGHRHVDHREIAQTEGLSTNKNDFIAHGNVRILPESGTINLSAMPTASQLKKIKEFVRYEGGDVSIEFSKVNGDSEHYVEYDAASGARIAADITRYYQEGIKPQTSTRFNRVYHGSAADFDAFDHKFMGSGEGSRVYGWGTYVSENDKVAKDYAIIAKRNADYDIQATKSGLDIEENQVLTRIQMIENRIKRAKASGKATEEQLNAYNEMLKYAKDELEEIEQKRQERYKDMNLDPKRRLYHVEIPDDNGKNYLDWNDAVSTDMLGRIKEEAAKEGYEDVADMVDYYTRNGEISGGDLYNKIIANGLFVYEKVKQADADKVASKLLNNAGIVGVKVPTNNMRGNGDKSKNNYVIFKESDAKIVSKEQFRRGEGVKPTVKSEEVTEAAKGMADKLHKEVKICQNADEISDESVKAAVKKAEAEGRTPTRKGWFNTRTGEIEVYAPAAESVEDVQKTVLHETVGHYGLRELLSDNEHDYNNAMVEMYRLMNKDQKAEVLKLMSERKYDVATAMDEYLAKMAEDRNNSVDPGFWQKAKSVVKNMLRKIGIDVELTDGDLKYLLWSSHEALKNSHEVVNADGSKSRVYDSKTMDQKAADWAMRWHNDVLGLRSKWEAERKAEGRGTEATVQAEANVSEEQARKAAEEAVKNRDTDPDDDPTTPGGGGSPSPTGGREYTIEQKLNMEAMKFDKQLEEIQNETDKKAVGDRLLRFVKERMQPLTGKRMTSMDINGLISKIEHAKNLTRKSAMENALLDIDDTIVHAEVSAEVEDMLNKLNIKTQTSTKKGLVKGVLVDDTANRILTDIKASYQQMINTTADARMSEIRREIRKKMAEYGISRQDDPAMPEELKNAIAPLKQQLAELAEQKKEMQTNQQMETLDQLNEREQFIQAEIGNIAANGGEMSEAYTEELMALPIKKKLAEMRKLKSLIDGVPEGGGDNLNRALEKTSRNSELWTALMKEKVRAQRNVARLSREINEELSNIVGEGRDRRRAEVQEEIRREIELDRITCNALRMNEVTDQQKQKANETFWTSIKDDLQKMSDLNNAPTFSFNFLLKLVDMNHGLGDGELYAHFMKSERGALKANNNMKMGIREFGKNVDDMAEKIFGKGNRASALESLIADSDKRTGKPIYKLTEKSPDPNAVQQRDDRNMTKGEMLYMWLTWRQEAGKLKMMQAGWTERSISEMEEQMGEEYKQFGTWASDVFLPRLRADKYNQTYRKIYGTDMHAAKHYFPIRIDKTAIMDKSEVGMNEPEGMPVSGASNLIVRTGNTLPVDASVNAIEMLLDYGRKMERWNAMQDLVKDLNTIYRCKAVGNLMEANHKGMYEIFKNAANVATGNFDIDEKNVYDKIFGYLQRGGTGAAIRYGWYTALKQTLSAPAFLSYDDSWRYQAIRLMNQTPLTAYKNYQWAKENLPAFADRIADNDMGIEGLNEKTVLDILTGKVAKYGMMANKVVDACTVANGAYAIYKYDSERYKKMLNDDGTRKYTDEQAEDMAKVNAELAFNESQQSSRNEFSSPVQKSRSIVNKGATAFQNSNIGYRRMALEGYHDWERAGRIRDNRIAQAEKIADETARNKAIEEAKAYYWKMKRRGAMKMATVGILNAWWFMGLNPALTCRIMTMNADDEDKDKFVKGMLMNVALGYLTNGTMLGPIISTGVTKIMNEDVRNIDLNPFMFLTVMNDAVNDVKNTLKNDDWGELSWALVKNSIRAGGGVDLEKFDNMYDGIYDIWERGDVKRDDIFKILNMPKSQRKEFAEHDVDLPISEYIKNYMSADKRVNPGERGKAWLGGIGYEKELTDTKMNDILKMYMNNKVNGFFERKKQLDNLNKEARKLYKEMTGKDKEEKNYKPLEWDKAMKEVTKDDPETQTAFLRYMNTAPDFKEKMTHSKKYDDLLKKLKDAVKDLRAGKEGSQKKVDESMEKLIDLEKKIVKLWPEKK